MALVRLAAGLLMMALLGNCVPIEAPPAEYSSHGASPDGPTPYAMLEAAPDLDGAVIGNAGGRATIAIVFASWCGNCRAELGELATLLDRPDLRIIGVNFRWQEEYDGRGDSAAVRAFVAREAPWLRVAPGGERLYGALGSPAKVPTVYVYDRDGRLAAVYDRRRGPMPDARALGDLLDAL